MEDPALVALGDFPVTVTSRAVRWIAIPQEETITVISWDREDAQHLVDAQQATQARWGVDQPCAARIDLAEVTAYFNERRGSWARAGVQVVAGPEYRTCTNDGLGVTHDLPETWARPIGSASTRNPDLESDHCRS